MGVAEIMDVGAGGIEKRGAQRIDPLAAPDHGDRLAAGEPAKRTQRDLDRRGAAAGERDREKIDQRALGLMPHRQRDILPPRRNNVVGEAFGHAGLVPHRDPLLKSAGASQGREKAQPGVRWTGLCSANTGNLKWRAPCERV